MLFEKIIKFLFFNRYQSRDWIGIWYEILKERGENDLISFVRQNKNCPEINDQFQFSHSIMDGTSSIPYYFRKFGQINEFPRSMTYKKEFSFLEVVKLTLKNMKIAPANNTKWKENLDRKIENIHDYARLSLTKEVSQKFDHYCTINKISENAILLEFVSKEILKLVEDPSIEHTWLFPVNVRGMVQKNNNEANHSSFIKINVSNNTTKENILTQMKESLKSYNYLGLWWVHHIGVIAPKSYLKKLSKKASETKFWLGSFSNVGKWYTNELYKPLCKTSEMSQEEDGWFFATPGSKNFPVSMVVMTLNDQMNFSMRIHPAICDKNLDMASNILKNLEKNIIEMYN